MGNIAFEIFTFSQPQKYSPIYQFQLEKRELIRQNLSSECLILLEHEPVFTAGKQFKPQHLLISLEDCIKKNIGLVQVDRGGDITYHGPGQIVGYPILNLNSRGITTSQYLRKLEQIIIDTLNYFDIPATRYPPFTGVWISERKISAIGVSIKNGISCHGFSINYDLDLTPFQWIIPCGISDKLVTSIEKEVSHRHTIPEKGYFINKLIRTFCNHFNISSYKFYTNM